MRNDSSEKQSRGTIVADDTPPLAEDVSQPTIPPPPPGVYAPPVVVQSHGTTRPAAAGVVGHLLWILALLAVLPLVLWIVLSVKDAQASGADYRIVCGALSVVGLGLLVQTVMGIGLLTMCSWARIGAVITLIAEFVLDTVAICISLSILAPSNGDDEVMTSGESIVVGCLIAATIIIPVLVNGGMVYALTRQEMVEAFRRAK